MANVYGFIQVFGMGDHDLARFLRKHHAINNDHSSGASVTWYGPDGRAVAQCHYDKAKSGEYTTWVRADRLGAR